MSRLRAGTIGLGNIAHRHAQALGELADRVELVACCSRDDSRARAFSEQYTAGRASVFTDHHTMFERAALDLVVICLPPFAHTDEVAQAAARGIHFLIEKPIALDSAEAWDMVRAAERAGIETQVSFMYRFGEAVEEFKRRQDAGTSGPVGLYSASYFSNALNAPWWRDRALSGGQVVEQVIHLFDLARYLAGDEPVRVYSRQNNLFHRDVPGYTVEDVSATVIEYRRGALAVIYATNAAVPDRWLKEWRIVAQRLVAEFTDWNHATLTPTDSPGEVEHIDSDRNVFVHQLDDLLTAIRTGGPTRTPLREGARTLDLALAAARSARSGAPVDLAIPSAG